MRQPLGVLELEAERLRVVPLEQRDEQRQRQERVRAELEQLRVVVCGQRLALRVVERKPARLLAGEHVQDDVGPLGLPPLDGAPGVLAVALDEFRVPVDGVKELVQQVLGHQATPPFGYQVKYASIVWNRSSVST